MTGYEKAFRKMRDVIKRASGKEPMLRCVAARVDWPLPAGYSYDARTDTISNAAGQIWRPDITMLPYTDVEVLPANGSQTIMLDAGGLRDGGERSVRLLPANAETVRQAAWCVLDDVSYVVNELTPEPAGAALWYMVRLRKR